jgi:hypothetical protein
VWNSVLDYTCAWNTLPSKSDSKRSELLFLASHHDYSSFFIASQFIVFSFSCSWGGIIYEEEYNPGFGPIHRGPNEGYEWRHCNTWWTSNAPQNWSQVLWDTAPQSEQSMNKSDHWLKISGKRKHFTALITLSSGSSNSVHREQGFFTCC